MIGTGSFVLEAVWPALALLVIIAAVIGLSRGTQSVWLLSRAAYSVSKSAFVFSIVVGSLVGSGLLFIMPIRFARQVADHAFLDQLQPDQISSITLGNKTFTSLRDVAVITAPLRSNQWFTSNHGGWSSQVHLAIRKRSGEERHFMVAFYTRDAGAVIQFLGPSEHGGIFTRGYAFSRDLPAALVQVGAPLPYNM